VNVWDLQKILAFEDMRLRRSEPETMILYYYISALDDLGLRRSGSYYTDFLISQERKELRSV
jgi:hypothetical protein